MKNKMLENMILDTDSYKFSHYEQYPPGTEKVYSYIEARKPANMGNGNTIDSVVFYGLKYILSQFEKITVRDVLEANELAKNHGVPFNYDGMMYIATELNGVLPIKIYAVPEGTVVPVSNVLLTIVNTDPKCFWLTSYLETMLVRLWYPCTVASVSRGVKTIIKKYLDLTSDNSDTQLPFKLHDFGSRGVSCREQAAIGGSAHLINFLGTDTIVGWKLAADIYDADVKTIGFSIPASEHSTITSWTKEREFDAYLNIVNKYAKPGSIFACVSDSYDIMNAVKNMWIPRLIPIVKEKESTVVIRPDSGDPVQTPIDIIRVLLAELVSDVTINSKGYKVLPSYVRVIQGDGMTLENIESILKILEKEKISAENIAFGMGAGLLQKIDRDTFSFAMKCSAMMINGEWFDVYKDPLGDSGKASKRGQLELILNENGEFETIPYRNSSWFESVMQCVYDNGPTDILKRTNFNEIRIRAKVK